MIWPNKISKQKIRIFLIFSSKSISPSYNYMQLHLEAELNISKLLQMQLQTDYILQ